MTVEHRTMNAIKQLIFNRNDLV